MSGFKDVSASKATCVYGLWIINLQVSTKGKLIQFWQHSLTGIKLNEMRTLLWQSKALFCAIASTDVTVTTSRLGFQSYVYKDCTAWISTLRRERFGMYPTQTSNDLVKELRMKMFYLLLKDYDVTNGETINTYKILAWTFKDRWPLQRPKYGWENNIKANLKKIRLWTGFSSFIPVSSNGS
jgi:hypothetical protein